MEELFNLETTSHYSNFYKITTQIPSIIYKIRIDISKTRDKNSRVFVFRDLSWSLIIEENFYFSNSQNNMAAASFSSEQPQNNCEKKKLEYLDKIYKILCL